MVSGSQRKIQKKNPDKVEKVDSVTDILEMQQNIKDNLILEEKIKALRMMSDLQDILISLLELSLKLSDIKSKIWKNVLIDAVEDLQNTANAALKEYLINSVAACKNGKVQEIMKCVASTNIKLEKESLDGIEEIIQETHNKCAMYLEAYTKCKTALRNFLRNVDNIVKSGNTSTNSNVNILYSVFGPLKLYDIPLPFTKSAFNEFELLQKDFSNPEHNSEDKLNLLIIAIEKAAIAHKALNSILLKITNFEYAKI